MLSLPKKSVPASIRSFLIHGAWITNAHQEGGKPIIEHGKERVFGDVQIREFKQIGIGRLERVQLEQGILGHLGKMERSHDSPLC
jgi:hypothetical protein